MTSASACKCRSASWTGGGLASALTTSRDLTVDTPDVFVGNIIVWSMVCVTVPNKMMYAHTLYHMRHDDAACIKQKSRAKRS